MTDASLTVVVNGVQHVVQVTLYASALDDALVVEVDTPEVVGRPVRVFVNDYLATTVPREV